MSIRVMDVVWKASGKFDPSSLLVLLALADWANDDGYCWPSVPSIAQKSRQGERNVRYILRKLERQGILSREEHRGKHNTNRYTINLQHSALKPAIQRTKTCKAFAAEPSITVKEPSSTSDKQNPLVAGFMLREAISSVRIDKGDRVTNYLDEYEDFPDKSYEDQIEELERKPKKIYPFETPLAKELQAKSRRGPIQLQGFRTLKEKIEWERMENEMPCQLITDKTDWATSETRMKHRYLIPNIIKAVYRTHGPETQQQNIGRVANDL